MKKIVSQKNIFLIALFTILSVFSCKKEPEVIIQKEIITDTVTVIDTQVISDTATTFILIRHAETTGIGTNPDLNNDGQERALELVTILNNITLDAIFSTNYNRTIQTATPVAMDKSLNIQTYNPSALEVFVDNHIISHKGKVILVVGHSNTTPDILNILNGGNTYSDLNEAEYNNLFIVTAYHKGNSNILHMKYGGN